jgi:hypothetical protein
MKNTYTISEWNPSLNLTDFYREAEAQGFYNNSSKERLIDSIAKEKEWNVWILYNNDRAVGSVAAHSLPEFGPNAYRILTRCCVLLEPEVFQSVRTKSVITQHQNINDQFYLPTCIEWAGRDKQLFATSHDTQVGSQHRVHRTYFPLLERLGIVENWGELDYRGKTQTFWRYNVESFEENLNKYPRW